jgi:hypothetical protein
MMPVLWTSPSLYQPQGRQLAVPWSVVAQRTEHPRRAPSKGALARIAFVDFRDGYRKLANVRQVHAVALDLDNGTELADVVAALGDLFALVHSTFSATEEHPRWRVIVPLDRPVDAEEHERAWRWLAMRVERAGIDPDFAARDASRAWAVPAVPPSGYYVARTLEGAFASVAEALAAIPEQEPLPEPEARPRDDSYAHRLLRARRYLERMPGAIAGSHGHAATFKASVAMVRGFGLDPDDALRLLVEVHNPICSPEWTRRELEHKVRQAFQRARVAFGALADRPRERRVGL